ncbi:MAG: hypothetical protein WC637_04140 [Victivallales bacterium]|jgi:hypothetical protein
MNDDKIDDAGKVKESDCGCDSGCACGSKGLSTKMKIIVCLVILIAAAIVLGRGFLKKSAVSNDKSKEAFASAFPVSKPVENPVMKEQAKESDVKPDKAKLWGEPLDSLASLNKVAANLDAVYIFISGKNDEKDPDIKKEIENAAGKFQARGSSIAAYSLVKVSKDYAQITSQVPSPCVLAMLRGKGMSVVSDNITEAKLLEALVAATRPSSCGPSGCGPSSPACP